MYIIIHILWYRLRYLIPIPHHTSIVFKRTVILENELTTELYVTILTNSREEKEKKNMTLMKEIISNVQGATDFVDPSLT